MKTNFKLILIFALIGLFILKYLKAGDSQSASNLKVKVNNNTLIPNDLRPTGEGMKINIISPGNMGGLKNYYAMYY